MDRNKWNGDAGTRIAPEGAVWLCCACGRQSRDVTGDKGARGWDESCMLNAVLVKEDSINRGQNGVTAAVMYDATN